MLVVLVSAAVVVFLVLFLLFLSVWFVFAFNCSFLPYDVYDRLLELFFQARYIQAPFRAVFNFIKYTVSTVSL